LEGALNIIELISKIAVYETENWRLRMLKL